MVTTNDAYDRYLRDISRHERITPQREAELSTIIQSGHNTEQAEAAIEELVNANLRLVIHCLKDFDKFLTSSAICITRLDLIAEGNIGLMDAARRFDAGFSEETTGAGVRFSTYACKCIKSRMRRALKLGRFIHIPEHHFTYWSAMDEMRNSYGEALTDDMLTDKLDVSPEVLGMLKQSEGSRTIMLDDMMRDDSDDGYWQDVLPNENSPCPSRETDSRDIRAFLLDQLEALPERTRDMLYSMYFGDSPCTLRDLAERYGISSERCRQVCVQGLNALRRQLEPDFSRIDPVLAAACVAA
jgi:RNA polymerase sigma factor (sigma-70 family)